MCPSMFYRLISHGRDDKTCKKSINQSKNELHINPGNSLQVQELQRHTEVTTCALYCSHSHQMKLKYIGYIYRKTRRTSCIIHKRGHISIFFSCSFLLCGRPDFYQWKFLMKHVLFRSHYKTHTHNLSLESLKYLHFETPSKTSNVNRPLIYYIKFCT
jgi:hypothetical protein